MSLEQLEALLSERVIEKVTTDRKAALRDLASAEAHVAGADAVSAIDLVGAFALAYDGARKAIVAHMRAHGLRVTARSGAHYRTGRYALAALDEHGIAEHLAAFEDLRRLRNKTEYEAVLVEQEDVAEAIVHARAIVAAVSADLG